MTVVFRINSSHIVNEKEIVLGITLHYFTPSCLLARTWYTGLIVRALMFNACTINPEYHSHLLYYIYKFAQKICVKD